MALVPVTILITDKTVLALPISGVTVGFFNSTGTTMLSQEMTGASGLVSTMLEAGAVPAGVSYQLRLFKNQVLFANPRMLQVIDPAVVVGTSNNFEIKGEPFVPPVSSDARFCMASGYFRTPTGAPAKNLDIHFIPKFDPLLLEGAGLLTERASNRTDRTGYMQVSLIRHAKYDVMVQGLEDFIREIWIPDQAKVNLPDLIFPVVEGVSFTPVAPFTVAVGAKLVIPTLVVGTDGRVLTPADGEVIFDSSNRAIALVGIQGTSIVIEGVAAGTCNVIATRSDTTIVRIPNTPITGVPAQITVT